MVPDAPYPANQRSGAVTTSVFTLTTTVSASEPCAPPTVSWNVSGPAVAGAVKVGDATAVSESVTAVPPVCAQEKVSTPPAGSTLFDPFSVTGAAPATTSKSSP